MARGGASGHGLRRGGRVREGLPLIGDERELVSACARGDRGAWAELVDRYQRLVYSIPRRYGLPAADCDDVFQSVFAALLAHVGNLRDGRSLPRWLITAAHREVWRRRRSGPAIPEHPGEAADGGVPPIEEVERLERQQFVHDALRELDERCEGLLRAVFLERPTPSYDVIAARLSMRPGGIGPTRLRCLEKLARLLQKHGALDSFAGG